MRTLTRSNIAGPLIAAAFMGIATTAASADFTGAVFKGAGDDLSDSMDLRVIRLHAQFDRTSDQLVRVKADLGVKSPLFHHQMSDGGPPLQALMKYLPDLRHTTYVAIGSDSVPFGECDSNVTFTNDVFADAKKIKGAWVLFDEEQPAGGRPDGTPDDFGDVFVMQIACVADSRLFGTVQWYWRNGETGEMQESVTTYDLGIGKSTYDLGVGEPAPDLGIGKRTPGPDLGVGKRAPAPDLGIGKRAPAPDLGIGKRTPDPDLGIGKRAPDPDLGVGKRTPNPDLGIGTRKRPNPYDLDNNNKVDAYDLDVIAEAWGGSAWGPPDFNYDGQVDATDWAMFLSAWKKRIFVRDDKLGIMPP